MTTDRPTPTPTPVVTPPPTPGDAFEDDNTCAQARSITTDGVGQEHTFHVAGDVDWVKFDAVKDMRYIIEAQTPASSSADTTIEIYSVCNSTTTAK